MFKRLFTGSLLLAFALTNIMGILIYMPHANALVTATAPPVAIASPAGVNGYTLLDQNGNIYNFGTAYLGGAGANKVAPFVSMAYTPDGKGYSLLDRDGHVYSYGDAQYLGGASAYKVADFVSIAYKPGTFGYTLLDKNGDIYNYGTDYLGGAAAYKVADFVSMAYTPTGNGYTLLDKNGDIYNYGDSQYKGGAAANKVADFSSIAYQPGTFNYTLMDKNGDIYNYGTSYLGGSPTGSTGGFIGMVYTPSGNGYAMSSGTGQIYNYGDSQYHGGIDTIMPQPGQVTPGNCSAGTDLGTAQGYLNGVEHDIEVCKVQGTIVNADISKNFNDMVNAARSSGVTLTTTSGFRTMQEQIILRMQNCGTSYYAIYQMPSTSCKRMTAIPGYSNHQMGHAIDFGYSSTSSSMYIWLTKHAATYGFYHYLTNDLPHWSTTGY